MEVICEVQYLFSEEGVMGETVDIVVTVLTHTIYSELCVHNNTERMSDCHF
jgi:hypothetical protein